MNSLQGAKKRICSGVVVTGLAFPIYYLPALFLFTGWSGFSAFLPILFAVSFPVALIVAGKGIAIFAHGSVICSGHRNN